MEELMITPLPKPKRPIVRINGHLTVSQPLEKQVVTYSPASNYSVFYVPIMAVTPMFLNQISWRQWAIQGIDGILALCRVAEVILNATLVVIGGLIMYRLVIRFHSKEE